MTLRQTIQNKHKLALDTPVFVYWFEDNPDYAGFLEPVFNEMKDGQFVFSVVGISEILTGTYKAQEPQLRKKYLTTFKHLPGLKIVDVDVWIADRAAQLRADHNLRTPDAIHIATALACEADVFLTNDNRLKRIPVIEVISLHDYARPAR